MTETKPRAEAGPRLRLAVADDEPIMLQFFRELLPPLGYDVAAEASTGRELVEKCREARPDLVITDIKMPDMDGITASEEINREQEVPVVLVSAHHDAELLARAQGDHVMSYLVKPVKPADVEAAVTMALTRFEQFRKARREAAELRQSLEDRKLTEQAKGVVIRRLHVEEPEAYRLMRKLASDRNWRLVEVARKVLESEAMFRALEETRARA
jgi:response regulator NasT